MLDSILQIFRRKPAAEPAGPRHALPPGQRVYAVGDIHGRLDLFTALVDAIEADDAARGPAETTIILLGDLVDRGPDSAGVIAAARALGQRRRLRMLSGNHEEMMLDGMENAEILRHFLRHGGRETLLSYPVDHATYRELTVEETRQLMPGLIPAEDLALLRGMEDMIVMGDYLFVHAGIRPGLPLAEQKPSDLRWIREPFLTSNEDLGWCVVHGHTITDEPVVRHNRIGIDTGAYMSGRLTALGIEGTSRWLIATAEGESGIDIVRQDA
jgi:serine/threonine protein phosphatase 1